jgi:D-beta-D-heptose 7-phosphate kinase/D-beta-D-heptose 1-phosphate adenosyltransferase
LSLVIPDFSQVRVLVAGDAMLDEYWFGDAARISPEAPVPVVRASSRDQRAGGAANVALNLSALGAKVSFAAIVGDDENGRILERCLIENQINSRLVKARDLPTVHKLRVLARNQQLIRLDAEARLDSAAPELTRSFEASLESQNIIVLSDYGKGTLGEVERLIELAGQRRIPVVIDPKGTDYARYSHATGLTPNQSEFEAIVGTPRDEADFLARAERLRDELALEFLLVTRGERGMTLVARDAEPLSLGAEAREVFDVTGAGDTVIALLGAGLGAGLDLGDAMALANLGAGLVVGKIGVATVTRSELSLALHRRGFGGRGLVSLDELAGIVAEAKLRGEKIVMTNGCFDILHAGHVSYLEAAKSLGDHLIVAVNDDASVKRLKGASRPVNALADRMSVLAGLAAVDWVVPFSDDTPSGAIERLLPDILVKGGDWNVEQIAGGGAVLRNGGEVRVLPFKEGRSTTALIAAIRGSTD